MRITTWRFFIVFAVIVLSLAEYTSAATFQESPKQVWQVGTARWDSAQEQSYTEWVEKTITPDFFIRHDIAVDCADVAYAARWIYSRIAHLPVAVTTEDGRFVGHWSTDFGHLPQAEEWSQDQRFRQSLLTLLGETSTRTMPFDTYPIRIATQSLSPGAMFLTEGHAGLVGRIVQDGSTYSPIQTWEATLPRKVQQVHQKSYLASEVDKSFGSGLVRFRWPVFTDGHWQFLPNQDHPDFSLEQYSQDFCRTNEAFDQAVARRIDPKVYEPEVKARLMVDSIYKHLLARVALVREGSSHCQGSNCSEGSLSWEVYSTQGCDEMIGFEISHVQKLIENNQQLGQALAKTMEDMVIPIAAGQTVTLKHVVENRGWLSYDPEDSIQARWALTKCDMIRSRIANSLESLDFVERRYRRTDPAYADGRRYNTMRDLKWLQGEGKDAGCDGLPPLPART